MSGKKTGYQLIQKVTLPNGDVNQVVLAGRKKPVSRAYAGRKLLEYRRKYWANEKKFPKKVWTFTFGTEDFHVTSEDGIEVRIMMCQA